MEEYVWTMLGMEGTKEVKLRQQRSIGNGQPWRLMLVLGFGRGGVEGEFERLEGQQSESGL